VTSVSFAWNEEHTGGLAIVAWEICFGGLRGVLTTGAGVVEGVNDELLTTDALDIGETDGWDGAVDGWLERRAFGG
jgi:hypothetical protein